MLKKYLKEDSDKFNTYIWQAYYKKFMKDYDLFATFDEEHQEKIYSLMEKYATVSEIYWFAHSVNDANISRLEDAIIKTNEAYYVYIFACYVKDANISKLEDAIMKTNNAGYIYYFANDIKNANKKRLMQKYKELKKK